MCRNSVRGGVTNASRPSVNLNMYPWRVVMVMQWGSSNFKGLYHSTSAAPVCVLKLDDPVIAVMVVLRQGMKINEEG
jgi:hypothetical protein